MKMMLLAVPRLAVMVSPAMLKGMNTEVGPGLGRASLQDTIDYQNHHFCRFFL